ncbi:MAG TPA: chorismate-binding protein [Bacillota bacterium]|nr:chorismate-binding protein [Bacillota bacterium]
MHTNQVRQVKVYHKQEEAGSRTPIDLFKGLKGNQKSMLESSFSQDERGMYSFIGTDPVLDIASDDQQTKVHNTRTNEQCTYEGDALDFIKDFQDPVDFPLDLPFYGGWIGYVGYDAIRSYVHIGKRKEHPLHMPDIHLLLYDTVIIFDHQAQIIHYVAIAFHQENMDTLKNRVENLIQTSNAETSLQTTTPTLHFKEMEHKELFLQQVKDAQQVMAEEGLEQVVLSKRFVASGVENPLTVYEKLRDSNPSPYMFHLEFGPYTLLGTSPESVVQITGDQVLTNPIAGTSPRGESLEEDYRLQQELLTNEKEMAEHRMLLEASKQEMHSICEHGTITIPVCSSVEMFEYVMHIVSNVQGTLKEDFTSMDALMQLLPAGTVSGTPKTEAMRLINAYESTSRGAYGGTVGYINANFDMNMALAIRCMTVKDKRAYIQAGAGIIPASIPEKEYEEIHHKLRSLTSVNDVL